MSRQPWLGLRRTGGGALLLVLFAVIATCFQGAAAAAPGSSPTCSYDVARKLPTLMHARVPERPSDKAVGRRCLIIDAAQPRPEAVPRIAAEGAGGSVDASNPSGFSSFRAAKTGMGSPGPGNVFDHVVEQSQIGRSGFDPEEIHNPFNMNPVSAETNQLKANYYSSKQFFTGGGTVRDWLTGQSFADQYEFGMDVLMRIEQGLPMP